MVELPSLQIIITAHKEGALLLPTFKSALLAEMVLTKKYDVNVEYLIYLDNPDSFTKDIAKEIAKKYTADVKVGNNKDPGLSRLAAVKHSKMEMIALLDGDDLWSENWLLETYDRIQASQDNDLKQTVYHPEYNLIFGAVDVLVRQGNIRDKFFDKRFLRVGNYWDALCVSHKTLFDQFPYVKNDVDAGFAHEDYLWVCETFLAGIKHECIENTIHFKRRRPGSVSVIAHDKVTKVKPNNINTYVREKI
jgi:glycosyltransferase involved in cell wall biosynthesis